MQEELENVEETQKEEIKFKSEGDDTVIKVDLSKPLEPKENEEETADSSADNAGVAGSDEAAEPAPEQEEVQAEGETQEAPALEEVNDEEPSEALQELVNEVEEAVEEAEASGTPLPENIQKLVDFIEETGGSIQDYARLSQDYSKMDNLTALQEYYKITKPHLDAEEISFLMEENFNFDEDVDDERDIRRKKIALKEQVAEAKAYLDGQKSKYYEEIKAGSKLTKEQQKAVDFFNRYNKESETKKQYQQKAKSAFNNKTNEVFSNSFKGFEYNVGDKKYRFNIDNVEKVKTSQSDINNFVGKFLGEDGTINNARDYHKSLFTAMNPDAIAKHFYEQGKADAVKDTVSKAKNISMDPRQSHSEVNSGGMKFKVLGNNSSDFKFKIKNKK